MELKNMSPEELISYRDDCREFLDEPERSLENINTYNEALAKINGRIKIVA